MIRSKLAELARYKSFYKIDLLLENSMKSEHKQRIVFFIDTGQGNVLQAYKCITKEVQNYTSTVIVLGFLRRSMEIGSVQYVMSMNQNKSYSM